MLADNMQMADKGTHGHTQNAGTIMLELEVLVCERLDTVDGGTTSTIAFKKVATLYHEIFDLGKMQG